MEHNYSGKYQYIRRVVLRNFKSVVDQEVYLAPLTILVGENSSGKSSLFQVIRLLEQANNAKQEGGKFPLNKDDGVKAGKIDDILSNYAQKNEPISIGFDLSIPAGNINAAFNDRYEALKADYIKGRDFGDFFEFAKDVEDDIFECYHHLDEWLINRKIDNYLVKWQVDIEGVNTGNPASANIRNLCLSLSDLYDRDQYQLLNIERVDKDATIQPTYEEAVSGVFHTHPTTKDRDKIKKIERFGYSFKGTDDLNSICAADLSGALPARFIIKKDINDISYSIAFELLEEIIRLDSFIGNHAYLDKDKERILSNKMTSSSDKMTLIEQSEAIAEAAIELSRLEKASKDKWIREKQTLVKEELLVFAADLVRMSAQKIEEKQGKRGYGFKFPEAIYSLPELINFACQYDISNDLSKHESIATAIADHLGVEEIALPVDEDKVFSRWREERTGILFGSVHYLDAFCTNNNIQYLGPLRNPPQTMRLTLPTGRPSDIGQSGELTAPVLNHLGSKKVKIPMPNGEQSSVPLIEGVEAWGARLGLLQAIRVVQEPRVGSTITVKTEGLDKEVPLDAVGVGVSQLLPVLVLCLLSEPENVILLEQPELHLHPALQQRLADFLIAIARSGRQLIVETHSEYMVSRLRRRIAEDPDDELLSISKVIFTERDRQTGVTTYRDVELSPYGDIDEWPKGFFDQAASEEREIIRGGLKKRAGKDF